MYHWPADSYYTHNEVSEFPRTLLNTFCIKGVSGCRPKCILTSALPFFISIHTDHSLHGKVPQKSIGFACYELVHQQERGCAVQAGWLLLFSLVAPA